MNHTLIHAFYEAFSRRDAEFMASCYHPEAQFNDPAFDLQGKDIGDMWRMLCTNGKDLILSYSRITMTKTAGAAHWEARYTFSTTGRKVHNVIEARFTFKDGKIMTHTDTFNFWRWSRQALGVVGLLLGWSPFLQNRVRATAMKGLRKFQASH
jgi:ketosteroid isomerase-like protein